MNFKEFIQQESSFGNFNNIHQAQDRSAIDLAQKLRSLIEKGLVQVDQRNYTLTVPKHLRKVAGFQKNGWGTEDLKTDGVFTENPDGSIVVSLGTLDKKIGVVQANYWAQWGKDKVAKGLNTVRDSLLRTTDRLPLHTGA